MRSYCLAPLSLKDFPIIITYRIWNRNERERKINDWKVHQNKLVNTVGLEREKESEVKGKALVPGLLDGRGRPVFQSFLRHKEE